MTLAASVRGRSGLVLFVALALAGAFAAGAQRGGSTIATEKVFEAIGLREGITVCEIGSGNGDLTLMAARVVGSAGRVYTSELGEERVTALQDRVAESGLSQITVVAGDPVKTNFPAAACDALFMRNVYHHFDDPAAMNASIAASLAAGARLAIVDFAPSSGDEATRPADRDQGSAHGVSAESVSRELAAAGFEPVSSELGAQRWFMVVVSKPK